MNKLFSTFKTFLAASSVLVLAACPSGNAPQSKPSTQGQNTVSHTAPKPKATVALALGGGALTGALASMLLKKKNTKKLVKAGSVAALGFLAYKGYQNWKQNRQQEELPQSAFQPAGLIGENHSRVILQTMIAAAASDGLIDDAERAAIERESGNDAEMAAWLQAEYAQPASIEQIAAAVGSDEALAAETYLAARLVCADLSRK